jgi:hypothetical protein
VIWERLVLQIVLLCEKSLEDPQLVIFNHCNLLSKEAMVRNRALLSGLSNTQLLQGERVERSGGRAKEVNIPLTTWKSLNNNLNRTPGCGEETP